MSTAKAFTAVIVFVVSVTVFTDRDHRSHPELSGTRLIGVVRFEIEELGTPTMIPMKQVMLQLPF